MTPEQQAWLRASVRRNLGRLQESAIFLAVFTTNFEEDAEAVMQFGLAVLLDKPIYLLVKEGTALNANVRRLARGIEAYRSLDDVGLAGQRLLAQAAKDLEAC